MTIKLIFLILLLLFLIVVGIPLVMIVLGIAGYEAWDYFGIGQWAMGSINGQPLTNKTVIAGINPKNYLSGTLNAYANPSNYVDRYSDIGETSDVINGNEQSGDIRRGPRIKI